MSLINHSESTCFSTRGSWANALLIWLAQFSISSTPVILNLKLKIFICGFKIFLKMFLGQVFA